MLSFRKKTSSKNCAQNVDINIVSLIYSQGLSIPKLSNLQTSACWQLVKSVCSGRRVWGIWAALNLCWPLKTFRQGAYRLSAMIYVCKDRAERRKRLRWAESIKCWNSYKIKSCRGEGRDVSSRPLALLPQQMTAGNYTPKDLLNKYCKWTKETCTESECLGGFWPSHTVSLTFGL